jgi:hypothetical protein
VFVADPGNGDVVEVPAGGGPQITVGTGLVSPRGVAVDAGGDVFVADPGHGDVVEVPAGGGPQTTLGTGLVSPSGVAVDAAGDLYVADAGGTEVVELPAGGGAQTTVGSGLNGAAGVAAYAPPPRFVADTPPTTAMSGVAYSYTYKARSPTGEPKATYRVASGVLPAGLKVNRTSGVLSGTPTSSGTFRVETENAATGTIGPETTITVTGI